VQDGEDAYGQLVLAYLEGRPRAREIVERDDGMIEATDGPASYFAPVRSWPAAERRGLRSVRGRVLDVGCGAGRVAFELQARGREVVAIDSSPLAVEVARRRGVRDARVLPFEQVGPALGRFDTVVMYGNTSVSSVARLRRDGSCGDCARSPAESLRRPGTPTTPTIRHTSPTRNGTDAAAACPAKSDYASVIASTPRAGSTI
jgi:SAM-dependent methyltransferase